MSIKNSSDTIGNRTRDLLASSAVPQPTAPPRAPYSVYRNTLFPLRLPFCHQCSLSFHLSLCHSLSLQVLFSFILSCFLSLIFLFSLVHYFVTSASSSISVTFFLIFTITVANMMKIWPSVFAKRKAKYRETTSKASVIVWKSSRKVRRLFAPGVFTYSME